MDYISKKFKDDFPEHFGLEVGSVDGKCFYQFQQAQDDYIETIIKKSLYVSDPKNFNDPFDCWGTLHNDIGEEHDVRVSIQEVRLQLGVRNLGVVCLTTNWENQLMWSHYAESHKGMCLGFKFHDSRYSAEDDEFILKPVQYQDLAPIPMSGAWEDECAGLPTEEASKLIIRTKNSSWHYEREWRIMCKPEHRGKRVPLEKLGAELSEVVFGMNMPDWKIIAISQAIVEAGIKTAFSKVYYDRESLKLGKEQFDV